MKVLIQNSLKISIALIICIVQSKVQFNKDLNVNGTLTGQTATFKSIHVTSLCNVDDLLSTDTLQAKVVDTQQLYVDVISSLADSGQPIVIQGQLIIEDEDEEPVVQAQTSQAAQQILAQMNKPKGLMQVSSPKVLSQQSQNLQQLSQQLVNPLEGLQSTYSNSDNDWRALGRYDFNQQEDVEESGWSFTQTSTCQSTQDRFLGGHCLLSREEVYKTFDNLPSHSRILILATFHFLDNWEGESAMVKLDDQVVYMKSVTASPYSVDLCGGDYKEAAFNVPVIVDTTHSAKSAKITFLTNLKKDPCEASLGIDNVGIYIK